MNIGDTIGEILDIILISNIHNYFIKITIKSIYSNTMSGQCKILLCCPGILVQMWSSFIHIAKNKIVYNSNAGDLSSQPHTWKSTEFPYATTPTVPSAGTQIPKQNNINQNLSFFHYINYLNTCMSMRIVKI